MGVRSKIYKTIWKCKAPLKIRIFLLLLYNRKIQAAVVLKRVERKCLVQKYGILLKLRIDLVTRDHWGIGGDFPLNLLQSPWSPN
jgi:hypothetical protein